MSCHAFFKLVLLVREYSAWGPDPHLKGAILVDRGAHCKLYALSAVSCAKTVNRSICRLGCGHEWAERCTNSIVFARWRQCALMGGRHLSKNIETNVYSGDAPYVKLI